MKRSNWRVGVQHTQENSKKNTRKEILWQMKSLHKFLSWHNKSARNHKEWLKSHKS